MTQRTASRLAWSSWAVSTSMYVVALVFVVIDRSARHPPGLSPTSQQIVDIVSNLAVPAIGALLVSKRRENPIGWIFCVAALALAVGQFGQSYAAHALYADPGSLPGAYALAWFGNWTWGIPIGALAFLLLLFPTGRLPSRRWRPVAWAAGAGAALITLFSLIQASSEWSRPFTNHSGPSPSPVVAAVFWVSFILFLVGMLGGPAASIMRYRRSRGEERQQLKWFVFSAALVGAVFVPNSFWSTPWLDVLFQVALTCLWVAIAVAILKYRLYDIDRVINRALVYGVLTAVLAGLYVGLAVGLGSLVGKNNSLVIAGSTLVVAALFRPARRGIQGFIDRRFYRRKYDAVRTLEAFSARLRDEVDLDELRAHLEAVVHETMQPAHASLWLRGPSV
ncbi:MAG: hypothetical protein M3Q23_13460 [Actinomycetota bacterium]|nr:hypothetical protein [Actinomycetota bacterium]